MSKTLNNIPTSLGRAILELGGRQERVIGNNTKLVKNDDGTVALVHFTTAIVIYRNDGIEIPNNGWDSRSTNQRINAALYDFPNTNVATLNFETKVHGVDQDGNPAALDMPVLVNFDDTIVSL